MNLPTTGIIASIAEPTPAAMLSAAVHAHAAHADVIELRFDALNDELEPLFSEVREKTGLPLLATCRNASQNGKFTGSERERAKRLMEAIGAGADFVDVEDESSPEFKEKIFSAARKSGCKIILSTHDFKGTPDWETLVSRFEEMRLQKPDMLKIVTTANSHQDGERVLGLIAKGREAGIHVIAFAMGAEGSFTRLEALARKSLTYASVFNATAPGQKTVAEVDAWRKQHLKKNRIK